MGPGLTSFFLSIGASAWLYNKLQKNSGNNTKQSLIASSISGVILFIIAFSIFSLIFK